MNNFVFKKSIAFFTVLLSIVSLAQAAEPAIDELDKICADHMAMVFHAYEHAKLAEVKEINFQNKLSTRLNVLGYPLYDLQMEPVPEEMCEGWIFKPVYGQTGGQFLFFDHCYKSLIGMLAFNSDKKLLCLSYRSSRQSSDWWHNFNFWSRECPYIDSEDKILLHSGYLDICENALPSLIQSLSEIRQTTDIDVMHDLQILITGHSLGGATAAVTIPYIKQLFPKHAIRLTTFGSPLVSSDDYNKWLENQGIVTKSFIRNTDITPSLVLDFSRQYLGHYIELPDYGDWRILWLQAHDNRKYRRAIYEHLGLDHISNLYTLSVGGFTI